MNRFEKFEKTCTAWYILLYPSVLVITLVLMLLFGIETSGENIAGAAFLSLLTDFGVLTFIGSFLYVLDEYKGSDKSDIRRGN